MDGKTIYLNLFYQWIAQRLSEAKENAVRSLILQRELCDIPVFDADDSCLKHTETLATIKDLNNAEKRFDWCRNQLLLRHCIRHRDAQSSTRKTSSLLSTRRILKELDRNSSRSIICLRRPSDVTELLKHVSPEFCVVRIQYETECNIPTDELTFIESAMDGFHRRCLSSLLDCDWEPPPDRSDTFPLLQQQQQSEAKLLVCIEGIRDFVDDEENNWSDDPAAMQKWSELISKSKARFVMTDLSPTVFHHSCCDLPCKMM
jgi:hypothetical protein